MDEDFTPANIKTIDLDMGARVYINTDEGHYEKVEGKSLKTVMLDEGQFNKEHPKMIGRTWACKLCKLDNQGVICSECKRWWNPADPNCEFKD